MGRCLILGCTRTKKETKSALPAIERYDGPTFLVLRKFLREAPPDLKDVTVYVLSARYGLISGDRRIEDYDRRMTDERACDLRPQGLDTLNSVLSQRFEDVLVLLSKTYLQALDGFEALVPPTTEVKVINTTPGRQLKELKAWLYKQPPKENNQKRDLPTLGHAILRGHKLDYTPEEIKEIGRNALDAQIGNAVNFRSWYTLIDEQKVNTKWLVSLLSGLKVSEFQASEARRVLQQLGIEVYKDD